MPVNPKNGRLITAKVNRGITALGRDLSIARRKRKLTMAMVAESAALSIDTVRRLERGDPGVSLGALGMVLLALGEVTRLSDLMDMGKDHLALSLDIMTLPKRVRRPKKTSPASVANASKEIA